MLGKLRGFYRLFCPFLCVVACRIPSSPLSLEMCPGSWVPFWALPLASSGVLPSHLAWCSGTNPQVFCVYWAAGSFLLLVCLTTVVHSPWPSVGLVFCWEISDVGVWGEGAATVPHVSAEPPGSPAAAATAAPRNSRRLDNYRFFSTALFIGENFKMSIVN